MDIPSLQLRPNGRVHVPLERLAGNKQLPESEKLAQASQAFEAILLRQILSEIQRPVFPSKLVGNSTTDGIYRDLVVEQMADNIARSGSFGLAKSLVSSLLRQSGAHTASAPATVPTGGTRSEHFGL